MNKVAHLPVTMGIAGGTGCGKTTVANAIRERVGVDMIAYLPHDAYYRDLSHLSKVQRDGENFDHPDALETDLMVMHLRELKDGRAVDVPVYNFSEHIRMGRTTRIYSRPVILVEGILIYTDPSLRDLLDVKMFLDTDADIRFIRRLQRDVTERGRTVDNVIRQYLATVRPGQMQFVEASKRFADLVILEGGLHEVAIDLLVARIEKLMSNGQ